ISSRNPVIDSTATITASGMATNITRSLQVVTRRNANFPRAFVAKQQVKMTGGSTYIDSFDSSDPTKSTGGQYVSTKRQANAIVASTSTSSSAIQAEIIYGTAATGPGGSMTLGSIGPTTNTA